jgi:hypothetical protein
MARNSNRTGGDSRNGTNTSRNSSTGNSRADKRPAPAISVTVQPVRGDSSLTAAQHADRARDFARLAAAHSAEAAAKARDQMREQREKPRRAR